MTLRGEIDAFPLETVVQLIHSTNKTGQLEVRGSDATGGTLGFDGGRLVAAIAGDDVGEPALGAVFAVAAGSFEFIPWTDVPAANLTGDLDQLLDRAVEERDRIVAIRKIVPDDRSRFRLSERAAEKGTITLSPDQWRTLLAVNGDRDVAGVAEHLHAGKLATRASLATLIETGFIDILEPAAPAPAPEPAPAAQWSAPAAEPQPQAWAPAVVEPAAPEAASAAVKPTAPEPQQWAPPAAQWEAPPAPPAAPSAWASAPAQEWERAAPTTPPWEPQAPTTDLRADLAAALDARISATPAIEPAPEAPSETSHTDLPPVQDERLAALSGVFGPAQPAAPEAPVIAAPPAEPAAQPADRINEWSRMAPAMQAEPAPEEKKKGRFGFLKRDAPARDAAPVEVVAAATSPSMPAAPAAGRAGQLASLANALLGEYNSGQYGKGRLDDRMANLLMRVDEQADPIDRPLPIVDDRIDAQALDRENVSEEQSIPYLAILVSQIFEDAERTFGKDKAKKGYRAATQQVFGTDTAPLGAPDVAGRLPKV